MFSQIGIFYILAWFFLLLLAIVQQAAGLPPELALPQWGPGIATLVMLLIFRKDGHKIVFFSKETPLTRYLLAALIPAGVGLVVFLISSLVPLEPSGGPAPYQSLLLFVLWLPFGALGEELGWRGYLHKKLDSCMSGLFSSLLVGLLWMPIHISFFAEGVLFVFFLALLIISFSIVIYALVQDTGFNVLLATVFHLMINLSNLLFLDVIYETPFMMVYALVWVVVAAIAVFMKRDIFLTPKS
jgi:membrane protease YdiL (CAAX protease family)